MVRSRDLHPVDHLRELLFRGSGGFVGEDAMLLELFLDFQQFAVVLIDFIIGELSSLSVKNI